MPHIVDLPNGEQAEFPDEMSPDQISLAIQKQFPPMNQNNQKVNTFLGEMQQPDIHQQLGNRNLINEMINTYGGVSPNNLINIAEEVPSILRNMPRLQKAISPFALPATGAAIGALSESEHPVMGGITGAALGSLPLGFNMGGKLLDLGKNALSKIPYEKIGEIYQSGHDVLKKSAENTFKKIGLEVIKRELPKFEINPKLIKKVSNYMPETMAAKKLLRNAKKGDYSSLRKLQTQLFKYGTKGLKSDIPTENIKGEEILDLRNRVNNAISKHLINTGNSDLSSSLKNAMNEYKNLQDTYYARKLSSSLKNMVHEESREIPKNIGELLDVKSVPTERIFQHNPNVFELVDKYSKNKNALKKLKILGIGTLGTGSLAGLAGLPSLYHKIAE